MESETLSPLCTISFFRSHLSEDVRIPILERMIEIGDKFNFEFCTCVLAISIFDSYTLHNLDNFDHYLTSLMSLSIASKIEEEYAAEMRDYVYVCLKKYTSKELIQHERHICNVLEYRFDFSISNMASKVFNSIAKLAFLAVLLSGGFTKHVLLECSTYPTKTKARKKPLSHEHRYIHMALEKLIHRESKLLHITPYLLSADTMKGFL